MAANRRPLSQTDGHLTVKPRAGVSSRLLGEPVRSDGGHSRFLTGDLGAHAGWVPFCPGIRSGIEKRQGAHRA
jgi:uncharacterized protein YbbK (DUF523 family)